MEVNQTIKQIDSDERNVQLVPPQIPSKKCTSEYQTRYPNHLSIPGISTDS